MKVEIAEVFFIKEAMKTVSIKATDAPMVGKLMEKLDKSLIVFRRSKRRSNPPLSDHGLLEAVLTSSDVTNFNLGNTNLTITAGVGRSITLGNASSSLTVFNNASTDIFNLTETTQRIGGRTNASISIDGNSITVDKTNEFIIESEDNDSDSMPVLKLFRNSTSPSDNDEIGEVRFTGEDSVGIETTYATIEGLINQESQSGEDGSLKISVTSQASLTEAFTVGPDGNSCATTSKTADEQKLDAISVYGRAFSILHLDLLPCINMGKIKTSQITKTKVQKKIYMKRVQMVSGSVQAITLIYLRTIIWGP